LLDKISENHSTLLDKYIISLYVASILFGQVFLSAMLNLLSIDNRSVMIVFRLSIMIFSYWYIFFSLRRKKVGNFLNTWIYSVLIFWCVYLLRLLFDVYISGVVLALPAWELFAWSLGSSLPIAICSYLIAAQNSLDFIFVKQVKYGVFLLGMSIIYFLVNPGLGQGRFYLQHLNAITCANAGCTLVLLCFAKLLLHKAGLINVNSSRLIAWLGVSIGSFIIVYSATRGVLFATLLIIGVSIFQFRARLRLSYVAKWKCISLLVIVSFSLILMISTSPVLLDKLFTANRALSVLTRLEFWKTTIDQIAINPFLGVGFRLQEILGSLVIEKGIYYPHNYVLESLAIGGIVMTLPLLYCMLFPVFNFYKKIELEPSSFPIGLLAAQVLIYSMHNGHLGDYPFFWMIIGMIAGSKHRTDKDVSESYS
jgi:O-antigen ligase